jgi:hypothetical protein
MGPSDFHAARGWPFQTTWLVVATHHRHGSRTLPRRPSAHADPTTPAGEDGFFGRLLPRPPTAFPFWQQGRLQRETIEACSGFMCFSACAFAPRLHRGLPQRLQGAISHLTCSSGYRANRQFPARDFHPLALETQEVSPSTTTSHLRPPFVPHCQGFTEADLCLSCDGFQSVAGGRARRGARPRRNEGSSGSSPR